MVEQLNDGAKFMVERADGSIVTRLLSFDTIKRLAPPDCYTTWYEVSADPEDDPVPLAFYMEEADPRSETTVDLSLPDAWLDTGPLSHWSSLSPLDRACPDEYDDMIMHLKHLAHLIDSNAIPRDDSVSTPFVIHVKNAPLVPMGVPVAEIVAAFT